MIESRKDEKLSLCCFFIALASSWSAKKLRTFLYIYAMTRWARISTLGQQSRKKLGEMVKEKEENRTRKCKRTMRCMFSVVLKPQSRPGREIRESRSGSVWFAFKESSQNFFTRLSRFVVENSNLTFVNVDFCVDVKNQRKWRCSAIVMFVVFGLCVLKFNLNWQSF